MRKTGFVEYIKKWGFVEYLKREIGRLSVKNVWFLEIFQNKFSVISANIRKINVFVFLNWWLNWVYFYLSDLIVLDLYILHVYTVPSGHGSRGENSMKVKQWGGDGIGKHDRP